MGPGHVVRRDRGRRRRWPPSGRRGDVSTRRPVPWWRVVRADGSLPPSHEENARPHYLDEGTPLRPSGAVDMTAAFWEPKPPAPLAPVEE